MNNHYLSTIWRLSDMLDAFGVPNFMDNSNDGYAVRFPWSDGDAACNSYTRGSGSGKVETYRFPWDDGDVSVLSVEQAARRIAAEYEAVCGE